MTLHYKSLSIIILCLTLCAKLYGQKAERKDYFKIGVMASQLRPAAGDVHFDFSDAGSGVFLKKDFRMQNMNLYGIDIGLIEVVRPKGLIINPFSLGLLFNNKTALMNLSTGLGYEVPLFSANVRSTSGQRREPVLKFRLGAQLAFDFTEYYLFDDVNSQNNNPIIVNNTPITKDIKIDILKNVWKVVFNAGFNCRITHQASLRAYVLYNGIFSDHEQLYFYESKVYYSKYKTVKGVKTGDGGYFSDAAGNKINKLFTQAPLMFKLEVAFLLE